MPANDPVLWKIQESIESDLAAIVSGNDYYYTADDIESRTNERQGFPPGKFIVGLATITREQEETQAYYYWRALFDVVATVAPVEGMPDGQARARLWADIQVAAMTNPKRTIDGTSYAIDTQMLEPDFQDQYDERIGLSCPVEVYYRTLINDPTSI